LIQNLKISQKGVYYEKEQDILKISTEKNRAVMDQNDKNTRERATLPGLQTIQSVEQSMPDNPKIQDC
jgi:hypothetical protein